MEEPPRSWAARARAIDALVPHVAPLVNNNTSTSRSSTAGSIIDAALSLPSSLNSLPLPLLQLQSLILTQSDFIPVQSLSSSPFATVSLVAPVNLASRTNRNTVYVQKCLQKASAYRMRFQQSPQHELAILRLSLPPTFPSPDYKPPPIPRLIASFSSATHLSIILQHAQGGDLWSYLEPLGGKGVDEAVVRRWMAEVVEAVEWLHGKGWAHRDLKPQNLLLTSAGNLLLTDFGSSASFDPLTSSISRTYARTLVGTPDYIAPEVLAHAEKIAEESVDTFMEDTNDGHERAYGSEVDWWGFGVVMFELLYGQTPFFSKTIADTYELIVNCVDTLAFPTTESRISGEVKDLLSKLLVPAPQRLDPASIKSHSWFRTTPWGSLHILKPLFMFSLLSKAVSGLSGRHSPCTWQPSDPVPSGAFQATEHLRAIVSSATRLTVQSHGSFAHGTIVFEAKGTEVGDAPPAYDAPSYPDEAKRRGGQLGDGQGVELRDQGAGVLELHVVTPQTSSSFLTSQLSFHITVTLPAGISTLASLSTSGPYWRTLGHASLSSLFFHHSSIHTSHAPINFSSLRAGDINLKTLNSTISGSYSSSSTLVAHTGNGRLEGTYIAEGDAELHTTNGDVKVDARGANINVYTRNGAVGGSYTAERKLVISNANGKIDGLFAGTAGVEVENSNSIISGGFTAGRELKLHTSNAPLDVKLVLVGEQREGSTTPPLFPGDQKTLQASREWEEGSVKVVLKTSNAKIKADVMERPRGVELDLVAHSANAGVEVNHYSAYAGTFDMSTSNASTRCEATHTHDIQYHQNGGNRSSGTIACEGVAPNASVKLSTSNAPLTFAVRA
ncbi:citron Rho-interacting kinase [Pseudohyphozyma bogoriensis]|nr:citron Rho-interacting kinase [Pseudohyphozyma bogoriensis]